MSLYGVRVLLAALMLTGVAAALAAGGADGAAASRVPRPQVTVERGTQCVEPPERMRLIHPDLLRHQRDRTVRVGERGAKVSLNACVQCHAGKPGSPAAGTVAGHPQAFCESCHAYAAVRLDCFECHQARVGAAGSAR
jgi:hypothetical protein